MSKILSMAVYFLVLVQGGFFERSFLPVCVFLMVSLIVTAARMEISEFIKILVKAKIEIILFLCIIITYLIMVFYHHIILKDCGRIGYILLILLLYICMMFVKDYNKLYCSVIYAGMFESIIALLAYIGLELPKVIVNARYMGTFQYANATALFMGIVLMLQWGIQKEKKVLMNGRIIMLVTLILTFSAGGILCYFLAVLLSEIIAYFRKENLFWDDMLKNIFENIVSTAFAISIYYSKFKAENILLVWVLIAGVIIVSIYFYKIWRNIERIGIKKISIFLSVITILEFGSGLFFFGNRIKGTGAERIMQISDAFSAIVKNPLVGLGINEWKHFIEKQPDITYRVSLVHNSYLQIGIEAGIFALIFSVCIICIWYYRLLQKQFDVKTWQVCIMTMAVLHFMADITFFFAGIIITIVICTFVKIKLKD